MPSSPSELLRIEEMATGENNSTWGDKLIISALRLIEQSIAANVTVAVNGDTDLVASNYIEDQARKAVIITTGAGGALTVPSTDKVYTIFNDCTGDLIVTTGGTPITLKTGVARQVIITSGNPRIVSINNLAGEAIENLGTPVNDTDAATKGSSEAFATALVNSAVSDLQIGALTTDQQTALAAVTTEIENGNFSRARQFYYASY